MEGKVKDDLLEYQKELTQYLIKASEAYYNSGNVIMTDEAFDKKVEKLKKIEEMTGIILSGSPTVNVGATVLNELKQVEHNHKMLSLDKCHSVEEVIEFANNKDIIAMLKCDGLTVSIKYVDGKLVSAETRGNGLVGSDITEHIKLFRNVPLAIDKKGTYIVDGEAIIFKNDFERINEDSNYANPRNLASGTLNSLDTSVVKERKLYFILWDVIEGGSYGYMTANFLEASKYGFSIVPFEECYGDSIDSIIDNMKEDAISSGFPIDGIVFKYNNITYGKSLGSTSHHLKNGIAYKFEDVGEETEIIDIEWTMGKTGVLTPTAVFKPVEIDGTTVERASVHNLGIMKFFDIHVGDKVEVIKANQIIPQISKNLSLVTSNRKRTEIDYPHKCPVCGSKTEVVNTVGAVVVMCGNDLCEGKLLGKLSHFVSKNAMNIDGLSEATLQKFIDMGWLKTFADIYKLEQHRVDIEKLEGFGKRSAEKLFDAIDKSKHVTLDKFINALSIPNIGRSGARNIAKNFNDNYEDFLLAFFNASNFVWHIIEDIGETTEESIIKYANSNKDNIKELLEFINFDEQEFDSKLDGQVFVITGSLTEFNNRNELVTVIEKNGGKVVSSVSAKTNYLINNDIESTSSKNKKAKELNIPIITEKELIEKLKK